MSNIKASQMVKYAVDNGFLPKVNTLTCVDCGKPATEYDHRNYDYPLGVEATCRKCNSRRGSAAGTHDEVKFTAVMIRLPQTIKDKAVDQAKRRDMSMSAWIRKLINRAK